VRGKTQAVPVKVVIRSDTRIEAAVQTTEVVGNLADLLLGRAEVVVAVLEMRSEEPVTDIMSGIACRPRG